jgi:hypothetical protein
VEVVHLDVRRRIARWPLPAALPSAAVLWRDGGERWTWWLPAGRELHRFDTQRWQSIERESMPGKVRALQSLDDALWALTEDDAESLLTVWRAGQWRRVRVVDGEPLTLDAEPAAQRLLVALGRPSRLLMLDAGGELRHEWPLPAGAALQGACWLPPAA